MFWLNRTISRALLGGLVVYTALLVSQIVVAVVLSWHLAPFWNLVVGETSSVALQNGFDTVMPWYLVAFLVSFITDLVLTRKYQREALMDINNFVVKLMMKNHMLVLGHWLRDNGMQPTPEQAEFFTKGCRTDILKAKDGSIS